MAEGPYFGYPSSPVDLSGTGCVVAFGWERISEDHTLDRGNTKRYMKGWRMTATLTWAVGSSAIEKSTLDGLVGVANANCSLYDLYFWPYPGAHPSVSYLVMWSNGFNFTYAKGLVGTGFTGSIQLIGKTIYENIPVMP